MKNGDIEGLFKFLREECALRTSDRDTAVKPNAFFTGVGVQHFRDKLEREFGIRYVMKVWLVLLLILFGLQCEPVRWK